MNQDELYTARPLKSEAISNEDIINKALILLEGHTLHIGGKSLDNYGLPIPNREVEVGLEKEVERELSYHTTELESYVGNNETKLTNEQEEVYQNILFDLTNENSSMLFLDAPGGTGKTYLIELLLTKIRMEGNIALAVASSGIAATLLPGGRTAHSTF